MMYKTYIFIFFISICIASMSQVLLKISANKKYKKTMQEYFNIYVMIGYVLLGLSSVLTTVAYRKIPLSYSPIFNGLGYIIVGGLSWIVLKEKITIQKVVGYVFIIVGILVYSLL